MCVSAVLLTIIIIIVIIAAWSHSHPLSLAAATATAAVSARESLPTHCYVHCTNERRSTERHWPIACTRTQSQPAISYGKTHAHSRRHIWILLHTHKIDRTLIAFANDTVLLKHTIFIFPSICMHECMRASDLRFVLQLARGSRGIIVCIVCVCVFTALWRIASCRCECVCFV